MGLLTVHVFDEVDGGTGVDSAVAADDAQGEDAEVLDWVAEEENGAPGCGDVVGCEDGDVWCGWGGAEGEEVGLHSF